MPSITYFNHIEPRPRSADLQRNLSTEVRDPLWFLSRHWQLGEFQSSDAGSPAFVEVSGKEAAATAWSKPGESCVHNLVRGLPHDAEFLGGSFTPNTELAVELGQRFESLLEELGPERGELLTHLRSVYPFLGPRDSTSALDPEFEDFFGVSRGRVVHGPLISLAIPTSFRLFG